MTQSPLPEASAMISIRRAPFFARPAFWGALFLLLLLVYAGWLIWLQWQAAEAFKQAHTLALEKQIERNAQLDAEAARLREALNLDPCLLRDLRDKRDKLNISPWQDIPPAYPDPQIPAPPSGIQTERALPQAYSATVLMKQAMLIQAGDQ